MSTASDFQRLRNAISTNLTKMNNNTKDIEELVRKLGTQEDSEPLRDRYLRLQNDTKSLIQQTKTVLQDIQNIPVESQADQRQKKNLTEDFVKQYSDIVKRFQNAQYVGARKEKESLARTKSVSYQNQHTNDSYDADNFAPPNSGFQQQVVLPMEQDVDLEALRERDEQLRQLERNIVEVNEIFKDVHNLVHEQGEIIDTIEQHVVSTESHVETAVIQTKQAVTYQSAARRKKIILIAILIIVIVIIALILGLYFGLKNK